MNSNKLAMLVVGGLVTVCASLMLGAIRFGVPAYAEEVAAATAKEVVKAHREHEQHDATEERQDQFDKRLKAVETGVRVLIQRSGGPPTDEEIRESRDVLEDLE